MPQKERTYRKLRAALRHQPNQVSDHLLAYTSFLSVIATNNKRPIFFQLWYNIATEKVTATTTMVRRSLVAASILIMLITILHEKAPQCIIATHSMQNITVPDGSIIYLNKNSEIYYKPGEWQEKRTVKLQGEAFFEVEKGPVFKVITALADVNILGTSFNVQVSDTIFSLHCYTGKVSVYSNTNHLHQLVFPGEAATLMENDWHLATFSLQNHPAWLSNPMQFSHQSLNNVFAIIEKRLGVSIEHPDYSGRYYTGILSSNNLDSIMQIICHPMNLTYKFINKRKIEIKSQNSSIN